MLNCWQEDPDNRPTFENLRRELKQMENQHKVNETQKQTKEHTNAQTLKTVTACAVTMNKLPSSKSSQHAHVCRQIEFNVYIYFILVSIYFFPYF